MSDHSAHSESEELAHHPSERKYVAVAVVLAIITALEVAIYYVKGIKGGLLVASLLAFAFVKFVLVAQWFMHLKFDNRMFRRLFVTGIILALIVFSIVLSTFFFRDGA